MQVIKGELLRSTLHGFTTRQGGVSKGPYAELNLGWQVGDCPADVRRNHQRVLRFLKWAPSRVAYMQQVHSADVVAVHSGGQISSCDGILTNRRGLMLWGYFADCTPIFIHDPIRQVVGLIHAGWRGTVKAIARSAVETLKAEYDCNPRDLLVYIGPRIGQCCYEVDSRVADYVKRFPWWQEVLNPQGAQRFRFDLAQCNLRILEDAGVIREHVEIAPYCTSCYPEIFFSHRRDGSSTGRMAGFIALP